MQRQIEVIFTIDWGNDGQVIKITPASGDGSVFYYSTKSQAVAEETASNASLNMLSIEGTGNSTKLVLSLGDIFSFASLKDSFFGAGRPFYYQVDFTNFRLKDADKISFSTIRGTFSTN